MKKFFIKILLHICFYSAIVEASISYNHPDSTSYSVMVQDSIQDLHRQRQWLINFLHNNKDKIKPCKHQKMERMIHNLNRRINLLKAQLDNPK